ncbi:methyltransferase [Streptomyces canus]|uniref:methyltransferase n=1 Tax=Streptomyces canus TaxID=58343 RepID=UPI00036468B3|nr:methyltransferase [Streptomyces canus]
MTDTHAPAALLDDFLTLADDSCVAVLPHVLRITAQLGIAEVIAAGICSVQEIAAETDTDPAALRRLLRALASVGVVDEEQPGLFRLTGAGHRLRADAENSVRESILNTDSQRAWLGALETFRTGRPVFDNTHGAEFFEHKDADIQANRAFLRRMRERAGRLYGQFVTVPDWSQSETVMDIGGGDGFVIDRVLREAGHLKGILFDRPPVVDGVREYPHLVALGERVRLEGGDFFETLPEGADTHLLCGVLHDWTDEQVLTILSNSRAALRQGGRLIIIDMVLPPDNRWHPSVWSDISMMVLMNGRERTESDFENLLRQAGFAMSSVTPVPHSYFSLVEAK